MMASQYGHLEIARELLAKGVYVNAATTTDGMASLMWTAQEGHLEIARLLLDRGAIVNAACTDDGYTPLMYASANGHQSTVQLLLASGANKDAVNNEGTSALDLAATQEIKFALNK